jgi:hypothetical protein
VLAVFFVERFAFCR